MTADNTKPYLSTGLAGETATDIQAQFADGLHIIPAWVVEHLGGNKVFSQEYIDALLELTFGQFMSGFSESVAAQNLNQLSQSLTRDHFIRLNRGW